MMSTQQIAHDSTFVFDGDYSNLAQVAHLRERFDELVDAERQRTGQRIVWNGFFVGKLGLEEDSEGEKTAIYLLQQARSRDDYNARVEELKAQHGAVPVFPDDMEDGEVRPGTVLRYRDEDFMSGWVTHEGARLKKARGTLWVMNKGSRTRGFPVWWANGQDGVVKVLLSEKK